MTRTSLAPALNLHAPEPYIEVHPADAADAGLEEGQLARIRTAHGEAVAVARITDRQRPGDLFMPMHWTDALAPSGRSNGLVGGHVDPASGQPEFKHTPARLSAYRETWRGFFLSRTPVVAPKGAELVWRRTPLEDCHLHEFAGRGDASERELVLKALTRGAGGEALSFDDPSLGSQRRAFIEGARLSRALFITTSGRLPPRDWLIELFLADSLSAEDRMGLLAGRPLAPRADVGPIVCACLKVGARTIDAAIAGGCLNVEAVGAATGAGTNCGSCRPQIATQIAARIAAVPKEFSDAA